MQAKVLFLPVHAPFPQLSLESVFEVCPDPSFSNSTRATPRGGVCEAQACTEYGVVDLPDRVWLFFAVLLLFPFVHNRSLSKNAWMSFVGVATILVVDLVVLVRCIEELRRHGFKRDTHHEWMLRDVVNSITIMAFAYGELRRLKEGHRPIAPIGVALCLLFA